MFQRNTRDFGENMPGIAGMISKRPPEECQCLVRAMTATMNCEAFYTSGAYSVPAMGIYVGWVAHERSFTAGQIFLNEKEDVALLFSGECFLDLQVGIELRRNGHHVGANQASWLVHLYEQEDAQFVQKLNGLFSGLLIDRRKREAFLFNDRYGMERIYWHETADSFYFASEAKALLKVLPESRTFDQQGVAQFLTYGCTLEEQTLFKGISRLPGGSLWTLENGTCLRQKYFSPESWESQLTLSAEQFESEFQSTFRRVLPRYTESRIPLGISLTAGLDTRMIMACLPETATNAVCYTYSGPSEDTLDVRLAARVAAACGLQHKVLRIGPDFFKNFLTWAEKTIYATDGNFGITGAHEIYLSRQARDVSSVRLTGIFGGEIFRSVCTFKPTNLSADLIQRDAKACELHYRNEHPVSFAAFKEIPWNMFGTVAACRSQLCLRSPYLDNELVALGYRAPLRSRKSSDSAVCFVRNNSKGLAAIPTDMGCLGSASGLAAAFNRMAAKITFKFDYYHSHGLPSKLSLFEPLVRPLAARMQHFGSHRYLHYHNWFRNELASYVKESLTDIQTLQSLFWKKEFLMHMSDEHLSGRKNYAPEINAVLTLGTIERLLFRTFSRSSEIPCVSEIKSFETAAIA
jgi:asparagine synthase (glutamine-hydrolysing)